MFNQSHHAQPKTIEYKVLNHSDMRKNTGWKTFCDVPNGFILDDQEEYRIKRQIETINNLFLSTVKIRVV